MDRLADGVGAQAYRQLMASCVASLLGAVNVHTPLSAMRQAQHLWAGETAEDALAGYEAWLALAADSLPVGALTAEQLAGFVEIRGVSDLAHARPDALALLKLTGRFKFTSTLPESLFNGSALEACLPRLRANFRTLGRWAFKQPRDPPAVLACASPPCRVVALHVRRGDLSLGGNVVGARWAPLSFVADAMALLRACAPALRHEYHVFSEGKAQDFAPLLAGKEEDGSSSSKNASVRLHLNGFSQAALHALVHAEVLVMGHSTLSRLAGALHQGAAVLGDVYRVGGTATNDVGVLATSWIRIYTDRDGVAAQDGWVAPDHATRLERCPPPPQLPRG